jgi:tRNA(adenine34) deaminase
MSPNTVDELYKGRALELAHCAEASGEVPVGALVVQEGRIIAEAWNRPISLSVPAGHAEILALRAAGAVSGNYRLPEATL